MTTRANPTKSWESACRHLFRHINNARELRRNPLVRHLFTDDQQEVFAHGDEVAVRAVHTAVLSALEDLQGSALAKGDAESAHRWGVIVKTHVLADGSPEDAAIELGLSRSQFYRNKREVCEAIARRMLKAQAGTGQAERPATESSRLALSTAKLLIEACRLTPAVEILQSLAQHSQDVNVRIHSLCMIASASVESGAFEEATRALESARAVFEQHKHTLLGSAAGICHVRIDLVASQLAWALGSSGEAMETAKRAVSRAESFGHVDGDLGRVLRELHVEALLRLSTQAELLGQFGIASKYLRAAETVFATVSEPAVGQRVRLLQLSASLMAISAPKSPDVEALYVKAQSIALAHNLTATALGESDSVAMSFAQRGDFAGAITYLEPLLESAMQFEQRRLIGRLALALAEFYAAENDFQKSLTLLKSARHFGCLNVLNVGRSYHLAANASLAIGNPQEALRYAKRAADIASQSSNRRLQSDAFRALALAYFANHDIARARDLIQDAVDIAESHADAWRLAQTYLVSGALTNNAAHARQAIKMGAANLLKAFPQFRDCALR